VLEREYIVKERDWIDCAGERIDGAVKREDRRCRGERIDCAGAREDRRCRRDKV